MDEQNGQAENEASRRQERGCGIATLVIGIILLAGVIPMTIREDRRREDVFNAVRDETGITLADLVSSPDHLYVWWEEWRISDDAHHKMHEYTDGLRTRQTLGTPDIPDPAAYTAFMAAHGIYETGPRGLYWRQLEPNTASKTTEPPPWAIAGYLPPFARDQIPPTGRLNTDNAAAEYRLVVDWQGQPISTEVLAQAALPLQDRFRSFFGPIYAAKIEEARSLHEIKECIDSYPFLSFAAVVTNLADRMEEGRIPAPEPLDDAVHAELRQANPGSRQFLDSVLVLCGQNHGALTTYAKSHGLSPIDAYNTLRTEREAALKASTQNPLAHYLFLGYPYAWVHWLLAIGAVAAFLISLDSVSEVVQAMLRPPSSEQELSATAEESPLDSAFSPPFPTVSSRKPSSLATRDSRNPVMNPTDPREIRASLAERGPVGRTMHHRKELDVSQKTKQQIEAETGIFEAQSEQFLTIRRKEAELYKLQNEIADHQDEGEMRDLKRQKRAAELEAEITRLRDDQELIRHNQEKRRKELEPKEAPRPSSSLSPKDKARKSWYAKRAQGMALSDVRDDEERRIREQFKDNPDALRAYLDLLQNWYEEELQK